MREPLWRKEAQFEGITAVCRIVTEENGEGNDDSSAFNPDSQDCTSRSIHLGFGVEENRASRSMLLKNIDIRTKYWCAGKDEQSLAQENKEFFMMEP